MRFKKTKQGKDRSIKNPAWVLQESMAHRLSDGEPLRIHTTMLRGTAPNHIHIFINSDSGTFSRYMTFTPRLDKVFANDRRLYTQIGSSACSFNTDWLRILQPRFFLTCLQLLNRDITGITAEFPLASSSKLSEGLILRWADIFYNHNTLLSFDWWKFVLVQIVARGHQTIKLLIGRFTYFISYT